MPANLLGGMGAPAGPYSTHGGGTGPTSKPKGHTKPAAMKATSQTAHVEHDVGRVVQQRPAHGAH